MTRGVRFRAQGRKSRVYRRLANWPDFSLMMPICSGAVVLQCFTI